jgi:hypothetical protein
VAHGKTDQETTSVEWKARFLRYCEWRMENRIRRLLQSSGRHGFCDTVSGAWKNESGDYHSRVEGTVFEIP